MSFKERECSKLAAQLREAEARCKEKCEALEEQWRQEREVLENRYRKVLNERNQFVSTGNI